MNITTLLNAVSATGKGTAFSMVSRHKAVEVSGTFVATVNVYGSNSSDTAAGVIIGTATAVGAIANEEPWAYVWADVSAYTSGTITVTLATPNEGA